MASALGTLIGLPLMFAGKKNMKYAIPFGPFLSIGSITYIFFGNTIVDWYFLIMQG
jgi:leader peptidase (prepilin peptidase)/N-methyltransferase